MKKGYYRKSFNIYTKFLRFLKPYWKAGLGAFILMVTAALLQLPTPLLTRYLIDTIVPLKDLWQLNLFAIILLGVIGVSNLVNYYENYLLIIYRNKVETDIRSLLFKKILVSRLQGLEKSKVGYVESRINTDVTAVGSLFMETVLNLFLNFLTFLVGVLLCFHLNPRLAVVSLLSLPLFIISYHAFSRKMNRLTLLRQEKWAELRGSSVEYLSQVKIIKAFNKAKQTAKLFAVTLKEAIDSQKKLQVFSVIATIMIGITGSLLPLFVLWYGVREIILGHFTLGGFIAFNTCIGYLYNPVQNFVSMNIDIHAALAAAQRIFEVLDYPEEETLFGNRDLQGITSIRLKNVAFFYQNDNDEKRGIEDISLSLEKGKKLAVVGETGKGKSTIARLILGLDVPQEGEILINGVDYRQFSLQSLRDHIGYVPQEPELLSGSILENIVFFAKDYDKTMVDRTVAWCALEKTLQRLQAGMDTMVYEAGTGLSGGEKQRIAIARALVRKPDLLILDEATSAVDPDTEKTLIDNILNLPWQPGIIVITHRYHYLERFHQVLRLQ
jgi:ABC-type bacteriocin/lantibiotic exporter with double-glycine peptidase domain